MTTIEANEGLLRISDAQTTQRLTEAEYLAANDALAGARRNLAQREGAAWADVPTDLKADGQRAWVAAEAAEDAATVAKAQALVSQLEYRMRNVRAELYTLGAFYGAPHREG